MNVLMIGVGNDYRSDDGAGLVAARRLQAQAPKAFRVLEHNADGADLMACWQGADAVFLIDAVQSGARPGTLHRWDATLEALPARMFRDSTHASGLVEAVEMARVLGQLPQRLIVYGIEGQNFEAGTGLSSQVDGAVSKLAQAIFQEAQRMSSHRKHWG